MYISKAHKATDKALKALRKGDLCPEATELAKKEQEPYGEMHPMGIDVTEGDVHIIYLHGASEQATDLQRALEEEIYQKDGLRCHVTTQNC